MLDRILTGGIVLLFRYAQVYAIMVVALAPIICALLFSAIRRK